MTDASDIPLQILLMATVARLRRKPPASTPIIKDSFEGATIVGSTPTAYGGDLTLVKASHDGAAIALFAVDASDAERVARGDTVTVWHGGAIMGIGYGVVTPADMAA